MTAGGGGLENRRPLRIYRTACARCDSHHQPTRARQHHDHDTCTRPGIGGEEKQRATGRDFNCFCWYRKTDIDRPDDWAIFYTHHRDSGLLDQSNAEVIAEAMEKFTEGDDPDVVFESHFHWACGHVDGFSVRVYRT